METQETKHHSLADREAVRRRVASLQQAGVTIIDPDRTYIGDAVTVGTGSILFPGTFLTGACSVGEGCQIGPDCWIEESVIESGCTVRYSVVESSRIRADSSVGPYAHLRPGADVGPQSRVGNFVEVKSSRLEKGVKAGHLAYIGDATIGERANIGAGTITCNYDGTEKHRTVIGKEAFVGSNTSLVAPLSLGDNAVIAAGSTITEDVPPGSLAFGRARQVNRLRDESGGGRAEPRDDRGESSEEGGK